MVLIERYNQRNPLDIFNGTLPPKGDLIYILFIALRETGMYETLDDFYDFIDDIKIRVPELTEIVLRLFKDMGFIEDIMEGNPDSSPNETTTSNSSDSKPKTFEQAMKELLGSYKQIGSADKFWTSNLEEVIHEFDVYKMQSRHLAENNYMLALMITSDIGLIMSGKKGQKIQPIEAFFPHLYSKEELEQREVQKRTQESVDNLMSFANRFKEAKKLKEQGLSRVTETDEEV